MLQPPVAGGGLRVWDAVWNGRDHDEAAVSVAARAPSIVAEYEAGDLVLIDSYRLHQIQPFAGDARSHLGDRSPGAVRRRLAMLVLNGGSALAVRRSSVAPANASWRLGS